jgi:hypothetical protein
MIRAVDVRRFHEPLQKAGLVPLNCRVVDLSIGVTGALVIRYEVFVTPEQLTALGLVFQQVAADIDAAYDKDPQP